MNKKRLHYSLFRNSHPALLGEYRCFADNTYYTVSQHSANRLLRYAKTHKFETSVKMDDDTTIIHIWLI